MIHLGLSFRFNPTYLSCTRRDHLLTSRPPFDWFYSRHSQSLNLPILYTSQPPFTRFCTRHDQWPWRVQNQVKNTFVRLGLLYTLWLKADLSSKCEFLNMSHLLIEGYILEISHGKMEYSLTIYLATKNISAKSERARTHRSQKSARAAVFAY